MKQGRLTDFWKPIEPSRETYKTQMQGSARTTLEPHYIRPIPIGSNYTQRLQDEYELIDRNQFARVFLQVKKILELIDGMGIERGKKIPHIIRGSAGSSLVCYLLGITHIDPIQFGIELARFMNRCRTDIPDIDIDVPYNIRESIFAKIASMWPKQVACISNHVMWKQKSATREVIKVALQEKAATEDVSKSLKAVRRRHFQLEKLIPEKTEQKEIQKQVKEKVGTLRTHSRHCGGIVIFEEEGEVPIDQILKPVTADAVVYSQLKLNKDEVEDAGMIKIDVLSNRGLAQIAEICPDRPLNQYPTRDSATERIFAKGWTLGVTFGESRGMRKIFMEMQPRNVEEIAIALALIRPAAAAEGRKQEFLEKWKKLGNEESKANGGLLRPIVFDDDAILKVRKALNCDSAEADRWRKAFAKGNPQARVQFRQLLQEKGHNRITIDTIISDLEQLVYYSFCKSHALSYAQLVWALGYWKAHHPHAFWCAALNHCHSEYRKWVHYREALCSGLQLSREPPPYKLGTRGGQPTLLAEEPEQGLLVDPETPQQAIRDMRQHGYWLTKDFLPGCGMRPESQQRLDGKQSVWFCGIIATSRVVHRDWGVCTLMCIGVDNRNYVDLVMPEVSRNDLFAYTAVEGKGTLRENQMTIDVEKIHGVSIRELGKRASS